MTTFPTFGKRELLWEMTINELYMWLDKAMESRGHKKPETAEEIKGQFQWDEDEGRWVIKSHPA